MNMMRFNEGGMTSDMLQQAMEAQAANMGQDITGDSFILTGQYSSPVQQEEDGREYVEYQHPDMQEPVKVYGNWNEYAVSQDENGMMLIGDEDYPIMQDEEGNYMLNEQKFDDQMTSITESQGAEAMAREAAQGSTQGASKMENLLEMLQDAQGPQGQGGQYEEGGEIPKYFLGGLFKKRKDLTKNIADKVAGNPLSAVGMFKAAAGGGGGGGGLLGMSGLGMMKKLMGRMRDRRGGGAQAQSAQAVQGAQATQANPGVRMIKAGAASPDQIAPSVAGAVDQSATAPVQQAATTIQQAAAANPRVRTSFEQGGQVKEFFAGGVLGLQNMRDRNTEFMAQQEAARQQRMAAYQAAGGGNQVSPALQQSLAATGGQITGADGSTMNVSVPGAPAGSAATIDAMNQQAVAAAAPAPAQTGQVPVQDPNAAVANQAAAMAQPQAGVATIGGGGGVMQDGGKVIKAYEEGGDVQGLLAMLDMMPSKPQISHEDLYKKYLKSRDKDSYMQQEGVSDIIKEQERIFMQRGRKFSDGTGYQDLFEAGGKMDEYAYGGKVVKAYENGGKDDEGDPPRIDTVSDVDFSDGEFTDFKPVPAYRTALANPNSGTVSTKAQGGEEISATSALLNRLNEGKLQTRLVDEKGKPIEDEQDWARMQERREEKLREDFKSGKIDAKSFEKRMEMLKGEADAFPEYVQAQGKNEATRNIYGRIAEGKDPEGHVKEVLDRESHWFDPNAPQFGEGGFDVHNPGHVMEYQMMYNQLAAPGNEIKVDGKWGEQTDSARVPIKESEKADLGGGVDPELEMRLFQEKPEEGWDYVPPGGGPPGGGGKKKKIVRKIVDKIGEVCGPGDTSCDAYNRAGGGKYSGGGRVVKYNKGGKFPDLNKDGKITMADILKGRGVKGKYRYGGKVMKYKC